MAYIDTIICVSCNQTKQVTVSSGEVRRICHECEGIENAKAKERYFKELDKLTLEERVRRIEEWIYHHKCIDPMDIRY